MKGPRGLLFLARSFLEAERALAHRILAFQAPPPEAKPSGEALSPKGARLVPLPLRDTLGMRFAFSEDMPTAGLVTERLKATSPTENAGSYTSPQGPRSKMRSEKPPDPSHSEASDARLWSEWTRVRPYLE